MLFNCCMNSSGFSEAVKLVSSFRVQKTRCSVAVFQTCSQWRHGSTSLKHGCTRSRKGRSMGPRPEDLPVFLTPSGMMELCDAQETKKSPLVGLDVAPTNFGIALSNKTRTRAFPVTVVQRVNINGIKFNPDAVFAELRNVIHDNSACGLVVGWPLTKSGIAETQCVMVLRFLSQMLLRGEVVLPVTLHDERMTTIIARSKLRHKKEIIGEDEVSALDNQTAAAVILQRFLDMHRAQGITSPEYR